MKLAIEISPFTRNTSGIYRYSANLVRALKQVDSTIEISSVSFSDAVGLAPTIPAEFAEIFGSPDVPIFDQGEARFGKSGVRFLKRKSTLFHRAYQRYRIQLRRKRGGKWTKLKRELSRNLALLIDRWRALGYRDVRHAVLTEKVDVIHSLFDAFPKTPAAIRPRLTCQTVHDVIPMLFEHSYVSYFAAIVDSARKADLVITVSECTKRDLLKLDGFRAENVVAIPLAVSENFRPMSAAAVAAVRSKIGIEADVPYFLSVSTFHPRKNFPFLLKTFRTLSEDGNFPGRLVLTGAQWGGEAEKEILALIKELGTQVIYTGFVSDEELAALYTGATRFLFPSLYEGFGLTPLEAMACGTPVICSNTSSLPEVVSDAGILLDPTDEAAWISAIREALQRTPEQREEASRQALARAAQFSWEKTAKLTLKAYRDALTRKPTNNS